MTPAELFSSCCAAIDRLLDGAGADTSPGMSEEDRALAIIRAARRDYPYTYDFWQRYRLPEEEDTGGADTQFRDKPRSDYRAGTGTDYSYRIGEGNYGKGKKGVKAHAQTNQKA